MNTEFTYLFFGIVVILTAFEKFHEQAKNKVDQGRKRAEKLAKNIIRLKEQGGLESTRSLSEDLLQNKDDKEDNKT